VCTAVYVIILHVRLPSPVTNLSLDSVQCRSVNISWERAYSDTSVCGQESYRVSVISINPPGGVMKIGSVLGDFENIFFYNWIEC